MNEKPGLEPGFFCSTGCWRTGYALLPARRVTSGLV